MKIRELDIVFNNANKILSEITNEYNTLRATPVISIGYGQIKQGMSAETIIQEAASTIVPSKIRQECIYLSILLRESRRYYSELDSSEIKKVTDLIRETLLRRSELLEVSEESHVSLVLDDLDYSLIDSLKKSPLVKEAPSSRSSIKLSLGKIKDLKNIKEKGGT